MPHRATPHRPPRREGARTDRILAALKRTVRAWAPTAVGPIAADCPRVGVARHR